MKVLAILSTIILDAFAVADPLQADSQGNEKNWKKTSKCLIPLYKRWYKNICTNGDGIWIDCKCLTPLLEKYHGWYKNIYADKMEYG